MTRFCYSVSKRGLALCNYPYWHAGLRVSGALLKGDRVSGRKVRNLPLHSGLVFLICSAPGATPAGVRPGVFLQQERYHSCQTSITYDAQ